jgi:hypothetical protein
LTSSWTAQLIKIDQRKKETRKTKKPSRGRQMLPVWGVRGDDGDDEIDGECVQMVWGNKERKQKIQKGQYILG